MNLQFGVDYYPEHWPVERVKTDIHLMREMGLQLVRMGEFSWSRMEPREGQWDFAWLDSALNLLSEAGIKVILGTPTAAPPAWVIEKFPDVLPVNSQGLRQGFGGRHHNCHSNQDYRDLAQRFLEKYSSRCSQHPAIVAWQIDNELGCGHEDVCYCSSCQLAFQNWLATKYQTIEELNKRWGTVFWSQGYNNFSQIPTAAEIQTMHNPSLLLDWKRFRSDLIISFQQFQIDIVRKNCPNHKITHNFMGFFDTIDYFKLAAPLDFISHDQYPQGFFQEPQPGPNPATLAATLDLMRGLKNQSFCIMEQQAGPTGWHVLGRTPEPGQLALWVAQSIARGADTIMFFRWRTCTVGTEQYWHGILPHNGIPNRRYSELQAAIKRLKPIMPKFAGGLPKAEVGILYSYEQNWALQIQPHHPELDYLKHILAYYTEFYNLQVPINFISENNLKNLSNYKFLIAPLLFLNLPGVAKKLQAYVEQGGSLLLTMRSGVKNADNVCQGGQDETSLPCQYAPLVGIEVQDYDCLRDITRAVHWDGEQFTANKWFDIIELKGAKPLAICADGWYRESPALTEHSVGKGKAYYAASEFCPQFLDKLANYIVQKVALTQYPTQFPKLPQGIELSHRDGNEGRFHFILNHTNEEKIILLPPNWETIEGSNKLLPYGFSVFLERR